MVGHRDWASDNLEDNDYEWLRNKCNLPSDYFILEAHA